ncbi:MAG: ATP-binding protein [Patescibacteria group bacterium]|nr:ATP-binding protein [Patescibacteria group bacterium]
MLFSKKPELTEEQKQEIEAQRVLQEGMTTIRDLIAPSAMEISPNFIKLGSIYCRTFFVQEYPRFMYAGWLSPLVNLDAVLDISIHIAPLDSADSAKKLRSKSTQIESTLVMNAEKGLVRDPKLEATYQDVEDLRERLSVGVSKLFHTSFYMTIYAKTPETLDDTTNIIESLLGEQMVVTKPCILQMEQGLNSTLPMGKDELGIARNIDTEALSTFFPFLSATLSTKTGIFYGINRINNSLVICDRFDLPNYNSVVMAMAGAGKSYAVKLEALRSLMFGTEIIVIDPENEYQEMCEKFNGAFLNININSEQRINPFDLPHSADPDDAIDDLRSNTLMLSGLLRIMVGEMTPQESNLLDAAIIETYASRGITEDPQTHNLEPPTLIDLQHVLEGFNGGKDLAAKLSKFTTGSYAGFLNNKSNINLDNRFVVFSIRDLEEELRPIAMYSILNYIWNRVKSSRKRRLLIVDEAWIMMKYKESAQFIFSIAKRGRKYFLGLTCISQDISDFLGSEYGQAIVHNASIAMLFRQHPAQVDYVKEAFHLTDSEKTFLLQAGVGECLFISENNHALVQITPSYQEDLVVTTNPEQLNEMENE